MSTRSADASTAELGTSVDASEVDDVFTGETKSGLAVKQGSLSAADERLEADEEEVSGEMDAGKTLEDLFGLFKGRLLPEGKREGGRRRWRRRSKSGMCFELFETENILAL